MLLEDILRAKGSEVYTVEPDATLAQVIRELVRRNVGSLVVVASDPTDDGQRVLGIITERDLLRAQASERLSLEERTVESVMTTDLVTASPDDRVEHAMGVMTENRVRHLPVLAGGRLLGIISIGDVVKAQHDELTMENHYMRHYIHGGAAGND
jgi:CBS domain-containing protein